LIRTEVPPLYLADFSFVTQMTHPLKIMESCASDGQKKNSEWEYKGQTLDFEELKDLGTIDHPLFAKKINSGAGLSQSGFTFALANGKTAVHFEVEVDVSEYDLLRYTEYHLDLAEKHNLKMKTVIFTQDTPKVHLFDKGQLSFAPTFVITTRKDAEDIMATMRKQIAANEPASVLDLVYLPLYQCDTKAPVILLKEGVTILRSTNLEQKQKQHIALLMLTVSNKFIDKQDLKSI
jgi:hypothetical protein